MRAAGLLLVGLGGMILAPLVLVSATGPLNGRVLVAILVAAVVVAEGLGLRSLRAWARPLTAIHALGVIAYAVFGGPLSHMGSSGSSGGVLVGLLLGIGLPAAVAMHAYSVPASVFSRAYRESPARAELPRPTPYPSPYFWIAAALAALGYGVWIVLAVG